MDITPGFRAAMQWRVWLLLLVLSLLPTLLVALPLRGLLAADFDYAVPAATWARSFDGIALAELVQLLGDKGASLRLDFLLALALGALLSPWATGILLHAIRTEPRARLGELLRVGLTYYARLFRLLLWALLPLLLAIGVFAGLSAWADSVAETAILASTAEHMAWLALGVGGLLLLIAHALIETARAWLGTELARRGAGRALWRALRLCLRHPLAVLGRYLLPLLVLLMPLLLLVLLRAHLPALGWPALLAGFALTQLVVIAGVIARSWRLAMLASLVRAHLSRPR